MECSDEMRRARERRRRSGGARPAEMQISLFLSQRTLHNKRHRDQAQLLQKAYNLAVAALNKGRTPHLDTVLVRDYQVPANQLSAIRLPHYEPAH